MRMVLSDIKRGFKIRTIMKRHELPATTIIACMAIIQRSSLYG